jgi:hypothetical protein
VSRGEGREGGGRKRKGREPYSADDSRHGGWHDSFMSHASQHGATRSTSDGIRLSVAPQQSM